METKPLLYGLIGFFIGGLIVAVAANTFDKAELQDTGSMDQMTSSLEGKKGDDYDRVFIAEMIQHHQDAVDMAKLSSANAKHDEVKQLSKGIIDAQEKEITTMKQWQVNWGYKDSMKMSH
ncbi:MAG TPA: DUF305 domain-containing protein [Candidatus Saccharimonadales bacterium]|nr:DUF305 domain-containing protein [Candidatus Saccharimonadales bacterium]